MTLNFERKISLDVMSVICENYSKYVVLDQYMCGDHDEINSFKIDIIVLDQIHVYQQLIRFFFIKNYWHMQSIIVGMEIDIFTFIVGFF